MASVINCPPPKRVLRLWNRLIIDFADEKDAKALEQAFAEARLLRENPNEFRRRYAEKHKIADCVASAE